MSIKYISQNGLVLRGHSTLSKQELKLRYFVNVTYIVLCI